MHSHAKGSKWSEQQIGVYHMLSNDSFGAGDVAILLHARPDCTVKEDIHKPYQSAGGVLHSFSEDAFALHAFVFSTLLRSWRWYLDDVAHDCRDLVG